MTERHGTGDEEPFAIGRETAAAAASERRHRETVSDPSPLESIRYSWRHHNLARLVDSAVDEAVQSLVDRYQAADGSERAAIRSALTADDFSTLLTFARRSAVRALQADDTHLAAEAVRAAALVDDERIDWRDVVWTLGLTSCLLRRLTPQADTVLRETIDTAKPEVGAMLRRFVGPSTEDANLATWGYMLVEVDGVLGLVERGVGRYAPTLDLIGVALQIADKLDGDLYRASSIRAAAELPSVWLPGGRPDETDLLVARSRGCVVINTRLAPDAHERSDAQQMTVFLLEAATETDAVRLQSWATRPSGHRALSVQHGPLLCLVVARSFVEGVETFETETSLMRLSQPLADILSRAT